MAKLGLLIIPFVIFACKKSEEKIICDVAKEFSDAYYNLNIRKAKEYCTQDLFPIMDFRHHNLTERDRAFAKAAGKAEIRVLDYEINLGDNLSYVNVEVSNFLRINYMTDSLSIVPCDTVELTLIKEFNNDWRVRDPM